MFNTSNICIFEGRMTNNTKITQVNGVNGPMDKATFSISCPKALSAQQRQDPNAKKNDFINFQMIGAQVKTLQQHFPAGTPVRVVAHYSTWEGTNQQTGQKTYGHNFEASYIGFVSTPAQNTGAAPQNNNSYQQAPQQNYQAPQNNGYQQAPQQNYQQQAPQQQMPQSNFEMFPQEEYPF